MLPDSVEVCSNPACSMLRVQQRERIDGIPTCVLPRGWWLTCSAKQYTQARSYLVSGPGISYSFSPHRLFAYLLTCPERHQNTSRSVDIPNTLVVTWAKRRRPVLSRGGNKGFLALEAWEEDALGANCSDFADFCGCSISRDLLLVKTPCTISEVATPCPLEVSRQSSLDRLRVGFEVGVELPSGPGDLGERRVGVVGLLMPAVGPVRFAGPDFSKKKY